jgi:kynurenine formamidase
VRPVERVVDLSVPIHEGMPVDDLGPKFWVRLSHAASGPLYQYTQSREGRVFLTTDHVGTHLDGPLRFDPRGLSVERVPLDRVIRRACLLDLRGVERGQPIGAAELERAGADLRAGDAAVLWTGHDRHLRSPDRSDPLVAAFEPMIQVARTPFKSTKYVEITQALGVMQQEVLTGAKPTAVSVKGASDRIDAILRD